MKFLFLYIILLFGHNVLGQSYKKYSSGKIYKTTVRDSSFKFDHANYSIFIPDGVPNIRGIFIHQHGCTMEGTGEATAFDIQYQAFAEKWHLAVIAPDLYPKENSNCHDWTNPEDGSGPALLAAIDSFARHSHRPELNEAPWLLWGHSGGGYWVLKMMTEYPERILAAFCYSAAFNPNLIFPASAAKIPIMLRHAGENDFRLCWQTASNTFIKLRGMNSYASLAYTANQTHNFSYVRYIAIPFFESVLLQRLPDSGFILKDMDISKAWIGDTLTHEIYELSTYQGHKGIKGMSLLPDSVAASLWKEYVSTGTVIDRSPPPPPYDLKISQKNSSNIYLSWKVKGDVESPIQYFNIFKNDKLIGRFPKFSMFQTFDTNGDNAIPIMPLPIKFCIALSTRESDTYTVSAVNQFNLESIKVAITSTPNRLNK